MALKKLPGDVQSILSASVQINTFRKAVEELVYNALDAESTSIAIRLHIQDSTIQVIDNGNGIQKHDFKALGQKHMTSKITDLSTLRSAPKTYGYRGQSLANIVIVSQAVTITSRYKDESEDTWVKTFHNGKGKRIADVSKRPSKGTTVEIKGFLYNLNIQKKSVDSLNELQNIKVFLEHISLVHNNISLSLRDDFQNEILFKIHKKRDIYQTLSNLFDIKENEIQELQVEKNNYKVKGLIVKTENECNRNWIYVNGKFIYNNSKLHKTLNENFNKAFLKTKHQRDIKSKNHADDNYLFKNNIPCYFIFITCPYIEYVISDTPKQSVLEFKNWESIKNLLQKLVKFYVGDVNLKEIQKPFQTHIHAVLKNQEKTVMKEDTRDQVKKIINKILGSNSKKIGVSQLQKGIKRKLIKRNVQRKLNKKTPKFSKNILKQGDIPIINNDVPQNMGFKKCKDKDKKITNIRHKNITKLNTDLKENNVNRKVTRNRNSCIPKTNEVKEFQSVPISNEHVLKKGPKNDGTGNSNAKKPHVKPDKRNLNECKKITKKIFSKFEKDFDSVEKRSRIIAEKAEQFLKYHVRNAEYKEQTHINLSQNNDVIPLPPKIDRSVIDKYILMKMKGKSFKTTYDLVHTILRTQQDLYAYKDNNFDSYNHFRDNNNCYSKLTSKYYSNVDRGSKLTFDSHSHNKNRGLQSGTDPKYTRKRDSNIGFITKQSKDNFIVPNEKLKFKLRNELKQRRKMCNNNRMYDVCLKQTVEESVYTIDFSKTGSKEYSSRINSPLNQSTYEIPKNTQTKLNKYNENNILDYEHIPVGGNTYTISPSDYPYNKNYNTQYRSPAQNTKWQEAYNGNITIVSDSTNKVHDTFDGVINKDNLSCNTKDIYCKNYEKNLNIIFVSKSQSPNMELTYMRNVDPLNMCETILDSPDIDKNELMDGFNINNKPNDSLFQTVTNTQEVCSRDALPVTVVENISHHFSNINGPDQNAVENFNNKERVSTVQIVQELYEDIAPNNDELNDNMTANNHFDFKDRLRFLPKGMSQIFAICNSKTACDYKLDDDYFEDSIYNNFANDVQANVEIYEPIIQNIKEFTTANVQKFNNKLNRENSSLIFDGISLKEAKVLGQIDCKFIAAVMRQKSYQSEETKEYLVLFDQHAVHERIRLEKNLADYLFDDQWKSVSLDNITLNLSKDEVLYLHNYEDKFSLLGLQWTILRDTEVSINAIPEAILGKNLREVENIIKAVRNLIKEEINIIKMQKGCVSLYPKSIMDLVFSEACRYAIKFGDTLSKTDCKELLQALSKCKTPFQCAHGRPVMAVLMEVGSVNREYNVDVNKIKQFMLKRNNRK